MCIRDRKNTVNKIENKIKYKIKNEQLRINKTEQHINNNKNKKWATFTYINNKMTKLIKPVSYTHLHKQHAQKLNYYETLLACFTQIKTHPSKFNYINYSKLKYINTPVSQIKSFYTKYHCLLREIDVVKEMCIRDSIMGYIYNACSCFTVMFKII